MVTAIPSERREGTATVAPTAASDASLHFVSQLDHARRMLDAALAQEEGVTAAIFDPVASGIQSLREVRAGILDTDESSLKPPVREQVLWDLDKVLDDAKKLHAQSLSIGAKSALVKAANLRIGVLLTPAFWTVSMRF